jgi:acyl-CoA thioesterase
MSEPSIVDAMMAADEASRALGIELIAHDDGNATTRLRVEPRHTNGHRVVHGGIVFALADTAFAAACNSRRPAVAAAAEIVFVAPARVGDELVAQAVQRVEFGRNGIYDVTVRRHAGDERGGDAGGEIVAEFRGRSHTLPEANRS